MSTGAFILLSWRCMTPGWHHYRWVNASMSKHCLRSRCLHLRCLLWFQAKIRVSLFLKDEENFLSFLGQLGLKKRNQLSLISQTADSSPLPLSLSLSLWRCRFSASKLIKKETSSRQQKDPWRKWDGSKRRKGKKNRKRVYNSCLRAREETG